MSLRKSRKLQVESISFIRGNRVCHTNGLWPHYDEVQSIEAREIATCNLKQGIEGQAAKQRSWKDI